MNMRSFIAAIVSAPLIALLPSIHQSAQSQPAVSERQGGVVVRIAELEINPAQLQAYLAAVKEEMAESIRVEPGVLAIYAVAEKNNTTHSAFLRSTPMR